MGIDGEDELLPFGSRLSKARIDQLHKIGFDRRMARNSRHTIQELLAEAVDLLVRHERAGKKP